MPYEVKPNGDMFEVVNTETGEVKAKHTDKEDAERQVRMLHELEREVHDGV
jgi:hypothetical protein